MQPGLPASLLAQRPDLQQSVALLRAANAHIGVAEAAYYPSLQLTSDLGYASEDLRNLMESGSRQFSIGPLALSLPIFNGGRNKSNLALTKARYDEAVANHEGKLLVALREIEDALSNTEQRQLQAQAQQAKVAAARAYMVARFRYERGITNFLEMTDAQRSAGSRPRCGADSNATLTDGGSGACYGWGLAGRRAGGGVGAEDALNPAWQLTPKIPD